jgi:hypothetical protein
MELNKYDLVEHLASRLKHMSCCNCPVNEECNKDGETIYICFDKEETKELLIKKYNL